MTWRPAPAPDTATLGDHRRYPGARLRLACAACGWSNGYDPERVIDRLRARCAGGHATRLWEIARRVVRSCPGCGAVRWRADFAWPAGIDEREVRRLANLYRN